MASWLGSTTQEESEKNAGTQSGAITAQQSHRSTRRVFIPYSFALDILSTTVPSGPLPLRPIGSRSSVRLGSRKGRIERWLKGQPHDDQRRDEIVVRAHEDDLFSADNTSGVL
jgi:hypothetical protein